MFGCTMMAARITQSKRRRSLMSARNSATVANSVLASTQASSITGSTGDATSWTCTSKLIGSGSSVSGWSATNFSKSPAEASRRFSSSTPSMKPLPRA